MKCAFCSFENRPEVRFCENCGRPIERKCLSCGELLDPKAKFCGNCGAPISHPVPKGTEKEIGGRLAALQQSAPNSLQEKIRFASAQVEGERKPVTIVFTDIVGSTSLAEKLDPEEWKEIVSEAHRIVGEAIFRYEGTIAQLLGDGVLAFFGAPITHEDDPIRAVRAGLDIQRAIAEYSRTLQGYVDNFQMRIGINTGTVVVGNVGSDMHMEYLAIGDSVNLAARLQTAALPGTVLVSAATARLVRAEFELKALGETMVKGKAEPVVVYEVVSAKAQPESGRGIEGLSSPLVGRQSELDILLERLARLEEGQGQIVSVLGEAGIGKSRLVEEARIGEHTWRGRREETETGRGEDREHQRRGGTVATRWIEGRSLSYGQTLSFWAITHLIKADLGLSDADPEARIRSALRRRTNNLLGPRASELLPYLAHLLGIRLEGEMEERVRGLDGETLKRQTLVSIAAYFEAVAQERPTVLMFEDMHWADPSTLEALECLLPLTDRGPLMVLMSMRLEREHGSWRVKLKAETDFTHRYTELSLEPLSTDSSNRLVDNLLEIADLPSSTRELILGRSEGNPLYLEEIIRSLIEQGAIVHEDHRWRATTNITNVTIPETLQGVLLARIDRLQEDVRRTLQLASVIGKSFLYRILEAVAEAERQLDQHLSQLQRVDLVREKTRRPELEYIFKHSLTQEAAYNSLLAERRREFHLKVGAALEQLFSDRKEEYFGLLAHHFDAAGDRDKAIGYLVKAGDKARLEDAQEEAIGFYRRSVELLTEEGDDERAAHTWLKIGLVHHANFDFEAAHYAYEMAFALERKKGTAARAASSPHYPTNLFRALAPTQTRTLDPGRVLFSHESWVCSNLFSGLGEIDPELNLVPHVARSWEVLDDGTRYILHLRDDVRWTNGEHVTASDFEWAWKRNLSPSTHAETARLLDDISGAQDYRLGQSPDPESVGVRALDPLTLEVRLTRPVAYFPYVFAQPVTYPLPRRVVEGYGDDWWKPEHIVSNGAFRLVVFGPDYQIWERNFDFFGDFPGNVDRVEARIILEESVRLQAFAQGQGDLAWLEFIGLGPELASLEIEQPKPLKVGALVLTPTCFPLDDVRVRRALIQAIDRSAATELLGATPATGGIIPTGMPGHSPGLGLSYDPALAQRLMAEAGYPGGDHFPKLTFRHYPNLKQGMEFMAGQWKETLGVDIELQIEEDGVDPTSGEAVPLLTVGWIADYPDPDTFMRQHSAIAYLKRVGWRDPEYDELVEQAARARDRRRRMAMYREADRLLVIEHALFMPFSYGMRSTRTLARQWVKGLRSSAISDGACREITIDPH